MKRLLLCLFLVFYFCLPSFSEESIQLKEIDGLIDITNDVKSYDITKADIIILGVDFYRSGCYFFKRCYNPIVLSREEVKSFSIDFPVFFYNHNDSRREYLENDLNIAISFNMQLNTITEKRSYGLSFIPTIFSESKTTLKGKLIDYKYPTNSAYGDYIARIEIPETSVGPYTTKIDDYKKGFNSVCNSMYNDIPISLKPYAQNVLKIESNYLNEKYLNVRGIVLDEDGNRTDKTSGNNSCDYRILAVLNSLTFSDGTTKTFNTINIDEKEWVSQGEQNEAIYPWEGKGTIDSPFLIKNANDLLALTTSYRFIDAGFYFKQESDIDISNNDFWGKPQEKLLLYYYEKPFMGYYDGNGKTISGLKIITTDKETPTVPKAPYNDYHGLFHRVRKAEIKNLTIDCEINIGENNKAGVLAGEAINSTISNITFSSKINGKEEIGGLVGNSINTKFYNITVKSNNIIGKKYVGGILGKGEEITADNIKMKDSTINGDNYVGGAFGRLEKNSKISNIEADVNVTSKKYGAGAIASIREYCSANNIYVSGKVTAEDEVGGIFGEIYGNKKKEDKQDTYYNFVSKADVTAIKGSAGGIVGSIAENASLSDCINYGTIMGMNCGGIASSIGIFGKYAVWGVTSVARCENHGTIKTTDQIKCYKAGGIAANHRMENTLKDCYNDGNIEAKEECGGIVGYNDRAYIDNCYAIGNLKTEYYDSRVGGITGMYFSPTGPVNSGKHSMVKNCFITSDTKFAFKGKPDDRKNNTHKCCSEEPTYKESYSNLQYFASASDIKLDSSWNSDVWEIRSGAYPKLKMANALVNKINVNTPNKVEETKEEKPVQEAPAQKVQVQDNQVNETPQIVVPEELELEP